jgi:hypothetical protein
MRNRVKDLKVKGRDGEGVIEALRGLETARKINCARLKSHQRGERHPTRSPVDAACSRVTQELRTSLAETIERLRFELQQIDLCISAILPLSRWSSKERPKMKLVRQERSVPRRKGR